MRFITILALDHQNVRRTRSSCKFALSQLAPAWIDLGTQSLHDIEGAIETWRQQARPEIEADLLTGTQSQFTQEIKKPES